VFRKKKQVFELATGDYLFDPKPSEEYPRDEDHLALCIELLGQMPHRIVDKGRNGKTFFNRNRELRHIKSLRYWGERGLQAINNRILRNRLQAINNRN
jgi:hypothetical protein